MNKRCSKFMTIEDYSVLDRDILISCPVAFQVASLIRALPVRTSFQWSEVIYILFMRK